MRFWESRYPDSIVAVSQHLLYSWLQAVFFNYKPDNKTDADYWLWL